MKGQGYRHGYLAAGVLTVSVIAFGWTTQWAPARDANTPKADRQWLTEEQQQAAAAAVIEDVRANGMPVVVREELERPQNAILTDPETAKQKKGWITLETGEQIRLLTARSAEVLGDAGLSTGGAGANGEACTCDNDCAAAPGECKVAHCVGGQCVQENAPVDTKCNFEGGTPLFCTEDRCNDAGVCVDTRAAIGSAVRLSPCSKQCCTTSACSLGSFQNCDEAGHCPGTEGCFPKRQLDGGTTYVATCDEANDRCIVGTSGVPNTPIGRCCTAGNCSETTEAACAGGNWVRWTDPDDSLHGCGNGIGCPKYSSGIAPVDAPGSQTLIGPVVPFPRRCAIGGGLCEVNSDCAYRCDGGTNVGEACDVDADCPGGGSPMCVAPGQVGGDSCVADAEECQDAGHFTTLGDDYTLSNGQYLRLSEFRFRGGTSEPQETVVFEFYDRTFTPARLVNAFAILFPNPGIRDYRLVVDCSPNCDLTQPPESFGEEEASDPPFIIPPMGYVVVRSGRAVDLEFGENDANFFWANSLSAPEVGTNDANVLWVNGGPTNFAGLGTDVLAFDFVGEKLANPPLAACCDPVTGVCTDRLEWDCQFCTNPARTPCVRARDCGLNNEFTCNSKDWKGAKTRLQVNADAYRDCSGRYCFNPLNPNPNSLTTCTGMGQGTCPSGQTCEAPCEIASCCVAAGPNAGCNEVTTVAQCISLGGLASDVVFGQKCTPDCCPQPLTGFDCCKDYYSCFLAGNDTDVQCTFRCSNNLSRPCTEDFECDAPGTCTLLPGTQADCPNGQVCNQVCDGPDNNADPLVHAINVPTYANGSEVIVRDFQGTTAGASYLDDCTLGGEDPGHYQIFTIGKVDPNDTCAVVTLNFCCSDPPVTGVGAAVSRSCPCAGGETIFADNNAQGQQAGFGAACNNDFCCSDNNASIQWTMPAGTYVYGITAARSCSNSAEGCAQDSDCDAGTWCARDNTGYQGHIYFKPCPPAACCGAPADPGESFCSVTDQFTCVNERKYCRTTGLPCDDASDCAPGVACVAGVFLGNKEVSPVPDCVGDPCTLGACCVAPGNCVDNMGAGITLAACVGNPGSPVFIGGFRCSETPCPVCPIETQDQCQTATTGQFILPSDRGLGVRRADDFRPAGNLIRQACFFPCFIGVTSNPQGFECNDANNLPPDAYIAKFYDDDFGKPGALLPGVPVNGFNLTVQAKANSDPGGGSRCWRYTAQINPPSGLTVTQGDCLWMEISGLGEQQAGGYCLVHALSSADGNNYSMRDVNLSYQLSDFDKNDLAFCLDSGILGASSPPTSQDGGCGNFPVACCRPGPQCIDGGTYTQCVGTTQAPVVGFPFPYITCAQLAGMGGCPIPANDLCSAAAMPTDNMNPEADCNHVGEPVNPNLGICSVSEGPPNIFEVCDTTNGSFPQHDCASPAATCGTLPMGSPGAYRCQFTTDNRLATTDGPASTSGTPAGTTSCFGSGAASFQADIWYKYTAPCNGTMTVHSCGPNKTYDSMLQIFSNDTGTCPTCMGLSNTLSKSCSDDNCGTNSSGSASTISVVEDGCYLIRYGGWSQLGSTADASQNVSGLDLGVVCDEVVAATAPGPAAAPLNRDKNRYLSFAPLNVGQTVAFRVEKLANAPNTGRCTVTGNVCTGVGQGNCAVGQTCVSPYPAGNAGGTCWVQAPQQVASGVPAQNTQFAAVCGTTPVFRIWTEPVVHVYGCPIIPTSAYRIFGNSPGPVENPVPFVTQTVPVPSLNSKLGGDIVGVNNGAEWTAANGFANVNDALALLAIIAANPIRPTHPTANVRGGSAGDGGCLNPQVNAADLQMITLSIAGASYGPPGTPQPVSPAACAVCPPI